MRKKSNLLGKKFGHSTVIGELPNDGEWVRWLCKCDCGKEIVKKAQDLRRGRSISCGCSHGNRKYDPLKSSALAVFTVNYTDTDMTIEQFMSITQQDCYYCGEPPSNSYTARSGAQFIYNGLDRVDPKLPHLLSNCVPCCRLCNFTKRNLTLDKFISHLKRIIDHLENGKITA